MSLELYVLAKRSQLPSVASWQAALDQSGFDVTLDGGVKPLEHSGFLPCSYHDAATGFEFSIGSRHDVIESYPELESQTDHLDAAATFVWGGDLNECVCAFCAAAVLTN